MSLNASIRQGDLAQTKKIFRRRKFDKRMPQETKNSLFSLACVRGHLAIARWLLRNIPQLPPDDYTVIGAFHGACRQGHLLTARWLLRINSEISRKKGRHHATFHIICKNGHLDTARWFYRIGSPILVPGFASGFQSACANGHLDVARWLLQIDPTCSVAIRAGNEYAFRHACAGNHVIIARWLLRLRPDINICAGDDWAFRHAVRNGAVDAVKWLVHIYPTSIIGDPSNYIFMLRYACAQNRVLLVKWLLANRPQFKLAANEQWVTRSVETDMWTWPTGNRVRQWLHQTTPYVCE